MSLSRLCEECRNCPYVDKCDNKRMEALGELPLPDCQLAAVMAGNAVTPLMAPILRETTTMVINGVQRRDREEIARRIHEAICGIEYAVNSSTNK